MKLCMQNLRDGSTKRDRESGKRLGWVNSSSRAMHRIEAWTGRETMTSARVSEARCVGKHVPLVSFKIC